MIVQVCTESGHALFVEGRGTRSVASLDNVDESAALLEGDTDELTTVPLHVYCTQADRPSSFRGRGLLEGLLLYCMHACPARRACRTAHSWLILPCYLAGCCILPVGMSAL